MPKRISQNQKNIRAWKKIKKFIQEGGSQFICNSADFLGFDSETRNSVKLEIEKERSSRKFDWTYALWGTDIDEMAKRIAFIDKMIAKYQPRKKVVK